MTASIKAGGRLHGEPAGHGLRRILLKLSGEALMGEDQIFIEILTGLEAGDSVIVP